MSREQRGGGEPRGGEVDFDAVLAGVMEEKRGTAEQEVAKAETRKKSKGKRAEIADALGGHLEGLATKGGVESEQELVATAFNTLIYTEYHSKKIPEGVQTKLDAYSQAKGKYAAALKKMENLPDDFKGDARLTQTLEKLKSEMIAQAKALAGELGVNYKEIAKGETALLSTDDLEIARLRDEADRLSPGKVEYAKESYGDCKERITGVLKGRMAERMKEIVGEVLKEKKLKESKDVSNEFGQYERQLVFTDRVDDKTRENIEIDEETIEKSVALLTQEELKKVFDAIEAGEPDEAKRRAAIDRLSRSFGRIIKMDSMPQFDRSKGGVVLLHPGSVEESKQPIPSWLIDAACAENRIGFFMQSIDTAGKSITEYSNTLRWQILHFLRTFKDKPQGFTTESYKDYVVIRNPEISTERRDDDRDSDLTDLALKMTQVMGKLRATYNFVYSYGEMDDTQNASVIFREMGRIKKGKRSITPEERKGSDRWNHALDVALNKHEPTNQDVVDKATKPDGTVRLDTPKKQEAMIAVLQERLQAALQLASEKAGEAQSIKYEKNDSERKVAALELERQRLEKRIQSVEGQLHGGIEELAQKTKNSDGWIARLKEEKRSLEAELNTLKNKIQKVAELAQAGQQEGLPVIGKAAEMARRQKILDDLEKLTR